MATARREVMIINKLGLHARAAAKFVSCAAAYSARIRAGRADGGGDLVDGKSIMAVMMLAAGKGTALVLEAEGEDAEAALAALCALIDNRFDEEE
ncbi:HPr family phosphocarrier protein [Pseudohaliea sp.]|uniref:HPr family phosphocarrier protein n=1 Tax=Pseudohaliea sp. TaxID=2740289 RepID=UPI0032EDE2E0